MQYIVYDTKHKVYSQGVDKVLGMFHVWGYGQDKAMRYTKRQANTIAAKNRSAYEVQEVPA